MSFRKIRPSFGESSASASNPSQSTSESTGSDPRQVRGQSASKDIDGSQTASKRRRVPESVTRNACLNCKKARAKCDGKQPCKRCASRVETSDCVYEIHIKHAKEELVRQIKELKAKDHVTEQILHALSSSDDEQIPEIVQRLRRGDEYQSIATWLEKATAADDEILSPRGSQHSLNLESSDHEMSGTKSNQFRWTYVTSNPAVIDHLLQLYFAWVHPVHTLFSEGHFVDSYKRESPQYCSETLVNAICAMACHLHSHDDADEIDFDALGACFSEAARSSIDATDMRLTSVQSFAVLFLVDCAQSQALRAASYLRVATNSIVNVPMVASERSLPVFQSTISGIRNLNVEWAQMTFQVPDTAGLAHMVILETSDIHLDNAKWYLYRYTTDKFPSSLPGLQATTNREKSRLLGIVTEILTTMYARHGPQARAIDVLQLYARLLAWRSNLPVELADGDHVDSHALPHVLSLLILYENTVVQLLRPLLDLDGFLVHLVEDVIWNHSQYALSLVNDRYRVQYTCRYQPVFQMFALLHLTDVIARFFPHAIEVGQAKSRDGAQAVEFGLQCLMHSHAGLPVAGALQEMLRRTANECSIPLPRNLNELMDTSRSPKQTYRIDDLLNACTRSSYVQPVAEIHKRYAPSFSVDWNSDSAAFGFHTLNIRERKLRVPSAEERGAQSLMHIRNLLNEN
ncbi:nitrogen assimilation transcription factor nit-4 (fungal specific transcription factor) [Phlyctema vagabunda]|uniref:Nitrogen assimilation transcription factor nit-4 (Fungal specific transcription factor) n=1 Tax=Phlyctema vagabunda TaxID=108571 RepID=A0ABR4PYQ6_9HELO